MSTKKKFIITLTSLSLVFIIAVVGLVLVLSASVQKSSAIVKVRYTAEKVSAQISARYALFDTDGNVWSNGLKSMKVVGANGVMTNQTQLAFGPEETENGMLAPEEEDIKLSKQYRQIIFEFSFYNTSNAFGINVTSIAFPERNNVRVKACMSDRDLFAVSEGQAVTNTNIVQASDILNEGVNINLAIAQEKQYKIYILVEIDNLLYDAYYKTTENPGGNGFAWSLIRADGTNA